MTGTTRAKTRLDFRRQAGPSSTISGAHTATTRIRPNVIFHGHFNDSAY